MKLGEVAPKTVVRNANNGHYYRYERPEGHRVRIRPLEQFPNGLLIAKPTDTIVESNLEVDIVGRWSDEFMVAPLANRKRFEKELAVKCVQLVELREQLLHIPPKERGSHANRIKAVEVRIAVLERGLADRVAQQVETVSKAAVKAAFKPLDVVQLPSGLPAQVIKPGVSSALVMVRCRTNEGLRVFNIQAACLRPWAQATRATI